MANTDMNNMFDLLMDRHDSSAENKSEFDSLGCMDMKDELDWLDTGDDFLNSILQEETPALLEPLDGFLREDEINQVSSATSDSGLSSEMDLSPIPEGLISPLPASISDSSDSETSTIMECASPLQTQTKIISMSGIKTPPTKVRRVIKMTPLNAATATNGKITRSILVPVSSIKNNVRTIRIIKTGSGPLQLTAPVIQAPILSSTTTDSKSDSSSSCDEADSMKYPKLELTCEEKRLLKKEGITLPTHYPLTKFEERELKRIRRKIRNKISAQDSRKRKKEYVDGLEERVKRCTDENATLLKRVKTLQNQNKSLIAQVKQLQKLVMQGGNGGNKQVQNKTCLMVLLLSLALVAVPNLKQGIQDNNSTAVDETPIEDVKNQGGIPIAGKSRTLLSNKYPVCNEEIPFFDDELCGLLDIDDDEDYKPPKKMIKYDNEPIINYLDLDDTWIRHQPPDPTDPISSTLDEKWPYLAKTVNDVIDDHMKPNSTVDRATLSQPSSVLLNVASSEK